MVAAAHRRSENGSDAKRRQILERSLEEFVAHGYVGTSTDRLAAAASVSKQTMYRLFGDKEGVFVALITEECDRVVDPFAPLVEEMGRVPDAEAGVMLLAEQFTASILTAKVQQLRRLVIAEATRFPELGRLYWERGFLRTISSVARCLEVLDSRALLEVDDAELAAHHFAGLMLWIPGNQAMFAGATVTERQVATSIRAGARTFLRAYAAG
ncbi:TetR/AcrR family transcriptional regulator [Georgenia sp. H159]|uniref:TetR/AcrR family transcriptional regulator n=1 Tax=Georgenia sp. H159 TaxID=3076115 RepID=UPI002D76B5A6|nr:TetR/AcrR family transcriptional regulator [Georgenia sp. H159]